MSYCASPSIPEHQPPVDPRKPPDDDTKGRDATSSTANEIPLLVTLSAGALGSLGFGLSVVVMWLRWIVPPAIPPPTPAIPVTKTSSHRSRRRRSAPLPIPVDISTPPVRRATLPKTSNVIEEAAVLHRSKHVSFLDPALPSARSGGFPREPFVSEQVLVEEPDPLPQHLVQTQPPVYGSPRSSSSSSSTLVHNPIQMDVDQSDEPVSDSSSRCSFPRRLPKMKNPFIGKARRRPCSAGALPKTCMSSATGVQYFTAQTKPSHLLPEEFDSKTTRIPKPSFIAQQSATPTPDVAAEGTTSKSARRPFGCRNSKHPATPSDSVRSSSSSRFSRKMDRRLSAPVPIPRTSPYEAPYFAAPPIPFDASYTLQQRQRSARNGMSFRSSPNHGWDGQEDDDPAAQLAAVEHSINQ